MDFRGDPSYVALVSDDPVILDLQAMQEQLDDELTATFVSDAMNQSLLALLAGDGPYDREARFEVWLQVSSLNEVGRLVLGVVALDYMALMMRRLGWSMSDMAAIVRERMEDRDADR